MDENNRLSWGIQIPHVDLSEQQQLQLYQQSQSQSTSTTRNINEYVPNNGPNRRSTNSVSSLLHVTRQSIDQNNTTDDLESISKVINVCNDIDIEDHCFTLNHLFASA